MRNHRFSGRPASVAAAGVLAVVVALGALPSVAVARPNPVPTAARPAAAGPTAPAAPRPAVAPGMRAEHAAGLELRALPPVAGRAVRSTRATEPAATAGPAATAVANAAGSAVAKPAPNPKPKAVPAAAGYRSRNHVWIPALRINRSVAFFPCERARPPDNFVYSWGCAGENNVYLMGHAHSVFKPLHDAYVSGRLRKGMKVVYADDAGRVRTYRVVWWKVVRPTTDAAWAWAPQSQASMTLQTCVGKDSSHRLMVRLTEAG